MLPESTHEYREDDVILYALGVGAGTGDDDLKFCYENGLEVLPTYGVIPSLGAVFAMIGIMDVNLMMLLHGEQAIRIHRKIPTRGTLTTTGKITAIWDKGKGAVIEVTSETGDDDGLIFENVFTAFIRGEGGFGGERGPSGDKNPKPDRDPDAVIDQKTLGQSNFIYRMSGDRNPLHVDPQFAKMAGFDRPILHGLCSYGHVARAVMQQYCENDPMRLKSFEARFKGVVFPGETLATSMWKEGNKVLFETITREREEVVLQSGAAEIE